MFEQESLQNESMEKYMWNQPLEHPKMVCTKWENTSPFFGQNPARHKMMVYAGHVPTHFVLEISRGIPKWKLLANEGTSYLYQPENLSNNWFNSEIACYYLAPQHTMLKKTYLKSTSANQNQPTLPNKKSNESASANKRSKAPLPNMAG